jgi:hypothetical protein
MPVDLYLDLLQKTLTNVIYEDPPIPFRPDDPATYDREARLGGRDWPSLAHTMVGEARLANVRSCLETVIADGVPGDFIETGVWRGGVCIFARGVLKAHGADDRDVWVADSFAGMPKPGDGDYPVDSELGLYKFNDVLGVSLETVQENFRRYDLLDEHVHFLPGWFHETLPSAPIEQLAVIRLDGDLGSSTEDALTHLYPKLSPGGFVIVDDYQIPACQKAVHDYRAAAGIEEPLIEIDTWAAYWRKTR